MGRSRAIGAVVLGLALLAGCSATSSGDSQEGDADDDFYAVPEPLPEGEHGKLIRHERLADELAPNSSTWRVMYLSESLEGEPIAVTGIVVVPDGDAPTGGWKLATVAHGTSGNADECAPSKDPADAPILDLEAPAAAGYVVAVTDYEGLGTPGRHPYLVGPSEGRSVLDAAFAARQLPGVDVEDRYGIVGYSQGGHAAAWAHQLAGEWAPDLDLVGSVAGAPPSELDVVFSAFAAGDPNGLFLMVAGFAEAYAEADPAQVLTETGLATLDGVDKGCLAMEETLGDTSLSEIVQPDAVTVEPWATLLKENDPGQVTTEIPLLLPYSAADTALAYTGGQLYDRLCSLGQLVERRVYEEGQDHDETAASKAGEMFDWIEARMNGEPAISTCP